MVGGPGFEPGASCSRTVLVECPRVSRWLRRGPPELRLPLLGVHPCSRRAAWCQGSVPRLCPSPSLTKPLIPPLGCGRPSPISASIETDTFDNERPQGGFFDRVTLVEVDGTNRLDSKTVRAIDFHEGGGFFDRVTLVEVDGTNRFAVQTRVDEALRILQL